MKLIYEHESRQLIKMEKELNMWDSNVPQIVKTNFNYLYHELIAFLKKREMKEEKRKQKKQNKKIQKLYEYKYILYNSF